YDRTNRIGYDSTGAPQEVSVDPYGNPEVKDPFADLPSQTDQKTGDIYKVRKGLPWQWQGKDETVAAEVELEKQQKALTQASTAIGRKLTLDEHAERQAALEHKNLAVKLSSQIPEIIGDETTKEEKAKLIDQRFEAEKQEANKTTGFFGFGSQTDQSVKDQQDIENRRIQAHKQLEDLYALGDKIAAHRDNIAQTQGLATNLAQQRVAGEIKQLRAQGIDVPEDSALVQEQAKSQVGPSTLDLPDDESLIPIPKSKAQQAEEQVKKAQELQAQGIQPPTAVNPVHPESTGKLYAPNTDGTFSFAGEGKSVEAVKQAATDKQITPEQYQAMVGRAAEADQKYSNLVKDAGDNPELLAILKGTAVGAGQGAVMLAAGTAAAEASAPTAAATYGTGPFIIGAIAALSAGWVYNAAQKKILSKLEDYSDTVKQINAASALHPNYEAGAEFAGNVIGMGGVKSVANIAQAAAMGARTGELPTALKALAKGIGISAGAGAGFELTLRPAYDATAYAVADQFGISHDQFQSPTVQSVATMATLAGLLAGKSIQFRPMPWKEVSSIYARGAVREQFGFGVSDAVTPEQMAAKFKEAGVNADPTRAAASEPLTPNEQVVYESLKKQIQSIQQKGAKGFNFAESTDLNKGVTAEMGGSTIASEGGVVPGEGKSRPLNGLPAPESPTSGGPDAGGGEIPPTTPEPIVETPSEPTGEPQSAFTPAETLADARLRLHRVAGAPALREIKGTPSEQLDAINAKLQEKHGVTDIPFQSGDIIDLGNAGQKTIQEVGSDFTFFKALDGTIDKIPTNQLREGINGGFIGIQSDIVKPNDAQRAISESEASTPENPVVENPIPDEGTNPVQHGEFPKEGYTAEEPVQKSAEPDPPKEQKGKQVAEKDPEQQAKLERLLEEKASIPMEKAIEIAKTSKIPESDPTPVDGTPLNPSETPVRKAAKNGTPLVDVVPVYFHRELGDDGMIRLSSGTSTPDDHEKMRKAYDQFLADVDSETTQNSGTVDDGAHQAAASPNNELNPPSEAQAEAGNYKHGPVEMTNGLPTIMVETPAGAKRRAEWPELQDHYGYIKQTHGADGDKLDVFIKPQTPLDWKGTVYVVNQNDPKTGKFDEHKVVIGAADEAEARKIYARNYESGWQGLHSIVPMSFDQFKDWSTSGQLTKRVRNTDVAPLSVDERNKATAERFDKSLSDEERTQRDASRKLPIAQQPPRYWMEDEAASKLGIGPDELTGEIRAGLQKQWENARKVAIQRKQPIYASTTVEPPKGYVREGNIFVHKSSVNPPPLEVAPGTSEGTPENGGMVELSGGDKFHNDISGTVYQVHNDGKVLDVTQDGKDYPIRVTVEDYPNRKFTPAEQANPSVEAGTNEQPFETRFMSAKELDEDQPNLPEGVVSIPNPKRVGILDEFLVGHKDDPQIKEYRIKNKLEEPSEQSTPSPTPEEKSPVKTPEPEMPTKASDKSVRDFPIRAVRVGDDIKVFMQSQKLDTFKASELSKLTEWDRKEILEKKYANWDEEPGGAEQAARLRDGIRNVFRKLVKPKPSLQDQIDANRKAKEAEKASLPPGEESGKQEPSNESKTSKASPEHGKGTPAKPDQGGKPTSAGLAEAGDGKKPSGEVSEARRVVEALVKKNQRLFANLGAELKDGSKDGLGESGGVRATLDGDLLFQELDHTAGRATIKSDGGDPDEWSAVTVDEEGSHLKDIAATPKGKFEAVHIAFWNSFPEPFQKAVEAMRPGLPKWKLGAESIRMLDQYQRLGFITESRIPKDRAAAEALYPLFQAKQPDEIESHLAEMNRFETETIAEVEASRKPAPQERATSPAKPEANAPPKNNPLPNRDSVLPEVKKSDALFDDAFGDLLDSKAPATIEQVGFPKEKRAV
ncbi:MAG: hypothetical protein D4R57_01095, partial [Verrucomicrobiales bacterium]